MICKNEDCLAQFTPNKYRRINQFYCSSKCGQHVSNRKKRIRLAHIDYCRKRLYGITGPEYATMLTKQNYLCAICQGPEKRKRNGKQMRLCVDHDHRTGKIRGLLCSACNMVIGKLESPELLRRAAMYLEKDTQT